MIRDEEFFRKLALSITHFVYRNTELEDYHSECVTMDMDFYKLMYNIVNEKMSIVARYNKYLMNKIPLDESEREGLFPYVDDLDFNCIFGTSWDKAKEIDIDSCPANITEYILSGEFLKSCQNGIELDDDAMCNINKDVHNRIYSLLINGYLK